MDQRYSEFTVEQPREEIGQLQEKAQKAAQMGNVSEYAVYERKIQVAYSYTLNPEDFKSGETYEIDGDPGYLFKITYINGVFAWGHRINLVGQQHEKEEALPISVFGKKL